MSTSPGNQVSVQEFKVRIPKRNARKVFHVMKFNASLKVDPTKWPQARMVRENNKKEFKGYEEEEQPKFGAGSEFGREAREEARRKKYGRHARKYDPEAQPWLLKIGSKKESKYYKGIQEGGVSENTSYYVFTHAQDGSFEAHPIKDWYNFTPKITHQTMSAEEAEERFAERGKILNHWSMAVQKKLKPDNKEGEDMDGDKEDGKKGAKIGKNFKISEMDDWVQSGDELDSEDEDDEDKKKKKKGEDSDDDESGNKKKKGRSKDSKKKGKKNEADLEGNEDSDDGDGEGREVDYMSDASSDSEEEVMEKADIKGVDQDEGLAKMLDSDSDSEEEKEKEDQDEDDEDNDEDKKKKKKKKKQKKDQKEEETEEGGKNSAKGSKNNSRDTTPTPQDGNASEKANRAEKRKAMVDNLLDPNESANKKSRLDSFGTLPSTSSGYSALETGFEEDVRRYLARKPMTTMELLKKFTSKKTGLSKEELTNLLVNVLKKVNPHKQKVKGTMYLSLKKS